VEKLKPVGLLTLVIWGVATASWIVLCVRNTASGSSTGFYIFLAVLWAASFCIMLYRYLKGRKSK